MYSGRSYQNDDHLPRYEYDPNVRIYSKRAKQYQCCSLLLILCALLILVVLLLDYAIQSPEIVNEGGPENATVLALTSNLKLSSNLKDDDITDKDIENALIWSKNELKMKNNYDSLNAQLPIGSAMHKHQQSTAVYKSAYELSRKGYIIAKASQKLYSEHESIKSGNKKLSIPNEDSSINLDFCNDDDIKFIESCKNKMYRTIDGSCNNLDHSKLWGTAMRPFRRILPADYCDGVFTPRCAKNGFKLPSARSVSTKLHRPEYENDPRFNVMFAVWGQFIDHDISATALTRGENGEFLSCCDMEESKMHPECYPVKIAKDDQYYSKNNVTCMDFVRSSPAPTCTFGPREQLNQVSSYLDGSVVYGNTDDLANSLRQFKDGLLKMYMTKDGRELLPLSEDPNDGCNQENEIKRGRYCFLSGDARANENLHLTTMHLILARQHNFVAKKLLNINGNWSDERVYQEARKIVSAQIQHITYNEFLDPLLGSDMMKKYDLRGYNNGYSRNYNDSMDASMSNVFATAAFRFAHTLLPGLIKNTGKSLGTEEYTELHRILFNPFALYNPGYLDNVIEGAIGTNVDKTDRFFTKEITEHLFESDEPAKKKVCGLDLVSLNIQRGRDHGIPSYPAWRKYCNLSPINSFDDLTGVIDPESIAVLGKLYNKVEDIDLYSGALSEYPIKGGMLGPTATCLIAEQFHRLKIGDRYWYENYQKPQAFSIDQLEEIRKTTLSKIICDNSDNLTMVPREIMKIGSLENRHINCNELSEINFSLWKENDDENTIGRLEKIEIDHQDEKEMLKKETTIAVETTVAPAVETTEMIPKQLLKASSKNTNIVKYFFSATITGGNVTGIKGSEEMVYFDGSFPVPLVVDEIINPGGWSTNADVQFKAHVEGNNTIIGDYTMPIYVTNNTVVETKTMTGKFTLNFIYKWGGDANIIIPNKQYNCKLIFVGAKKSTANNDVMKRAVLKEVPLDVGEESCSILLKGYFYERSFLCNIFPWWCSNSKIYYWNNEIEMSIKKNIGPSNELKLLKSSKQETKDEFIREHPNLSNIYSGQVISGWININSTETIKFPINIKLPAYINYYYNNTMKYLNIFGREITWGCDYFHNSLFGKFYIPFYMNGQIVERIKGKFSLNLNSELSLYKLFVPSMQYSTYIHLQDKTTNQLINVTNPDSMIMADPSKTISSKLILVGNKSKPNNFEWYGNFMILLEKVPNYYF